MTSSITATSPQVTPQSNLTSPLSSLPPSHLVTPISTTHSHTSDPTWEVTSKDDIIDSLSEFEEEEEDFVLPIEKLLDTTTTTTMDSGRTVKQGRDTVPPATSDIIEINPSPPMINSCPPNQSDLTKFQPPFKAAAPSSTVPLSSHAPSQGSSVRPSQGAMPDNASEFKGPYPHTQEMWKIFTQVHYHRVSRDNTFETGTLLGQIKMS